MFVVGLDIDTFVSRVKQILLFQVVLYAGT